MSKKRVGFALCGSFCTLREVIDQLAELARNYDITPIMSYNAANLDTRFGRALDFIEELERVCGRPVIKTIQEAEPIGPKNMFDLLVVAPCTGNTLAKLAHSIADTPVTMAAKSHLRNGRPILVAVSTNDALGGAAENIGKLLARKHYYFVPFGQDDPLNKPTSMVADFTKIPQAMMEALGGRQMQPILL